MWSDESSLHKLAKEVLAEEKKIMLPLIQGEQKARQLEFDNVKEETRDPETGLIPDCVCYYEENKLWVEFKRTHEVDTKKADKIRNAKIDCIEIDINDCEINKEAVRHFIVEESTKRIWIYNSKTHQTKVWREHSGGNKAEYAEHDYIVIDRHFAYDENAYLVNLYNISPTYDLSAHHYYCIKCGKEVKYNNGHFDHIEENNKCTDEIFLLNTAKEVIYNNFYFKKKYEIEIPKHRVCEKINTCIFADTSRCFSSRCEPFDLKSVGYKICEKNFKRPGQNEILCDIVFRNAASLENAILVNLFTENCKRDLDTSFRIIEVHISNENDVAKLTEGLYKGLARNFSEESEIQAKPEETHVSILKFSLFRSGKAFIKPVPCSTYDSPRNNKVIHEISYIGNNYSEESIQSIKQFSLISCYERNHIGCYCEICAYLKRNPNYPPICIRYKTQGTPRNPLVSKKCDCKAFSLDKKLAEKLRKEYKDIKRFEVDYR